MFPKKERQLAVIISSSEANEPNTQEKTHTRDYLGLISLGMLLFAVAVVFL
jgi:hypothetical protein